MRLLVLFGFVMCSVLAQEEEEKEIHPPYLKKGEQELVIDAIFLGLGDSNAKDGIDHLNIDYTNKTKENMSQIIAQRSRKLNYQYCGSLANSLGHFTVEHALEFGVTEKILPKFDAYDVGQRILLVVTQTSKKNALQLSECEKTVSSKENIPSREQALWILLCFASAKKNDEFNLSGREIVQKWSVSAAVDAALEAIYEALECPNEMIRLTTAQLDMEYKHAGLRDAQRQNAITKERLDGLLSKNPIPTRADWRRTLAAARIKLANTNDAKKSKQDL